MIERTQLWIQDFQYYSIVQIKWPKKLLSFLKFFAGRKNKSFCRLLNKELILVVGKKLQKIDVKEYSEQENTHIQASATAVGAGSMLSPDMTSAAGISETNMGANDGQSVPPPVQNEGEASTVGGVGAGNESATVGSVSQAAFAGQNGTASKQHAVAAKENTNVKILFKLPSSVCVPEMEIQVGRWNEEKKCWKIDGISDVAYDKG